MFGKIIGRFELANANASWNDICFSCIRNAITQDEDRLTPAKQ